MYTAYQINYYTYVYVSNLSISILIYTIMLWWCTAGVYYLVNSFESILSILSLYFSFSPCVYTIYVLWISKCYLRFRDIGRSETFKTDLLHYRCGSITPSEYAEQNQSKIIPGSVFNNVDVIADGRYRF